MYITQIYQLWCFEGTGGCLRIKGCSHDKITQGWPGLAWFLSAVEHSWIRSGLKPLNTQCPFDYASSCHSRASSGHYKIQYLHRGFIACKRGTILFPHLRCHHEDLLFLIQWFGYGQKKDFNVNKSQLWSLHCFPHRCRCEAGGEDKNWGESKKLRKLNPFLMQMREIRFASCLWRRYSLICSIFKSCLFFFFFFIQIENVFT